MDSCFSFIKGSGTRVCIGRGSGSDLFSLLSSIQCGRLRTLVGCTRCLGSARSRGLVTVCASLLGSCTRQGLKQRRCRFVTQMLSYVHGLGNKRTIIGDLITRFQVGCGHHPTVVRILKGFWG